MKVNAELDLQAGATKKELIEALDGVPDDAVISIQTHEAGWGGTDWHTMKFTWEVGNGKSVYKKERDGYNQWPSDTELYR